MARFNAALGDGIPAPNKARVDEFDAIEEKSGSLPVDLQLEYLGLVWPAYFPEPGAGAAGA